MRAVRSAIILQSLYPGNPIYTWTAKEGYVLKDPTFELPKSVWLSNQTGIRVATYGSVDIDSFQNLLSGLPSVLSDLMLDAAEKTGFKDTRAISKARWARLSKPRPTVGEKELLDNTLYAVRGEQTFMLDITASGKGGWYQVSGVREGVKFHTFPMWDYTVYCPEVQTVTLPSACTRRLITATLDSLYCYPEDDAIRSYLVWAQDKIHNLWEVSGLHEGEGTSKPDRDV